MKKNSGVAKRSHISGNRSTVGSFIRGGRDAIVRSFDISLVSRALKAFRDKVPYVRNRVLGTFMFTFGVYSALIAVFRIVFSFGGNISDVFASACVAIAAIPFIISKGTVYTALSTSRTGRVISSCIGIRLQALGGNNAIGRENLAFLFGMIAGTLTFVFEPLKVISLIVGVIATGIVLTYPESAAVMIAAILPFAGTDALCYVAVIGAISFAIKVMRGKRKLNITSHIKVMAVFLAVILFAEIFSGSVSFTVLALVSMIIALPAGMNGRSEKIAAAAVAFTAVFAAVMTFFKASEVLLRVKVNFEIIDIVAVSVLCAALIPITVSFMISGNPIPQGTALLCSFSMWSFLMVFDSMLCMVAAAVGVMLLLFVYKRRAAYCVMAVVSACYAVWVWLGGSNRMAFNILLRFLKDLGWGVDEGETAATLVFGAGLSSGFEGESLIGAMLPAIGSVGAVIFVFFILLLCVYILKQKNESNEKNVKKNYGFMSSWSAFCSVVTLLICGLGINIWKDSSVYVLFWLMVGCASAAASEAQKRMMRIEEAKQNTHNENSAEIVLSVTKAASAKK